ncbi:DgyrCDS12643 [Dimorphilus gyrociliatus]|uniref:DgyrCDS12643 n=1 Tax=Dimorphilus gyrociliatus TaxID=2664684 RepID=A0A7I8W754_9ANNE|nr:DgyrCDS12643 [Dimorphilus gyrociliatus]
MSSNQEYQSKSGETDSPNIKKECLSKDYGISQTVTQLTPSHTQKHNPEINKCFAEEKFFNTTTPNKNCESSRSLEANDQEQSHKMSNPNELHERNQYTLEDLSSFINENSPSAYLKEKFEKISIENTDKYHNMSLEIKNLKKKEESLVEGQKNMKLMLDMALKNLADKESLVRNLELQLKIRSDECFTLKKRLKDIVRGKVSNAMEISTGLNTDLIIEEEQQDMCNTGNHKCEAIKLLLRLINISRELGQLGAEHEKHLKLVKEKFKSRCELLKLPSTFVASCGTEYERMFERQQDSRKKVATLQTTIEELQKSANFQYLKLAMEDGVDLRIELSDKRFNEKKLTKIIEVLKYKLAAFKNYMHGTDADESSSDEIGCELGDGNEKDAVVELLMKKNKNLYSGIKRNSASFDLLNRCLSLEEENTQLQIKIDSLEAIAEAKDSPEIGNVTEHTNSKYRMDIVEELKWENYELKSKINDINNQLQDHNSKERDWKKETFHLKKTVESLTNINSNLEQEVSQLKILHDEGRLKYDELQYSMIDMQAQLTAYEQEKSDDKKTKSVECTSGSLTKKKNSLLNVANDWKNYSENRTTESISDCVKAAVEEHIEQKYNVYDDSTYLQKIENNDDYLYDTQLGLFYAPAVDKYFRHNAEDNSYSMLLPSEVGRKAREPPVQENSVEEDKESGIIEREPVLMRDLPEKEDKNKKEEKVSQEKEPPEKRMCISEEDEHKWPSYVRIMVHKSNVLELGTVIVVGSQGGLIGSGVKCIIRLKDIDVEHLEIAFDKRLKRYTMVDKGSDIGTFVNNKRLGESGKVSEPQIISNKDLVQISDSVFEFHVHSGPNTCLECEPGVVRAYLLDKEKTKPKPGPKSARKKFYQEMKKKYGLEV